MQWARRWCFHSNSAPKVQSPTLYVLYLVISSSPLAAWLCDWCWMLGGVSYSVPVGVEILPKFECTSKGGCVKTEIVCSCYALWLNFTAPLALFKGTLSVTVHVVA